MVGTISTLGIGSGLDLQGMLEQLREIDQQVIDTKSAKKTGYEVQLEEFTTVKNKLLTLKSNALNLSLSSNFLGRTITSSNEDVATATVVDGAMEKSFDFEVNRLAARNSWLSAAGVDSADTSVYVPVSVESTTGVADSATTVVAHAGETMTITYGSFDTIQSISLSIDADMTMDELADAINTDAENGGASTYVTASTYEVDGETFLRIESTAAGSGEDCRVAISETLSDLDFGTPDAMLSFQIGDGDPVSISVAADTTLSQLADLINESKDNPGISAKVINDGNPTAPYRLSLQSDTYGEDGRITFLTQLADMGFEEQKGADGESLNAQFSVDGINYQRNSNTLTDIAEGLTVTLKNTGSSTLSIGTNNTDLKDMIKGLVEAYNDVLQEVKTNASYNTDTGEFGSLFGTTLRDLPNSLATLMTSSVRADQSGKVNSLFSLGLEFNRDGTVTLNEETLDGVLTDSRDAVTAFFVGDSDRDIQGFADIVNERIRILTGAGGQIEGEKQSVQSRIDDIEAKVEVETERLDKKYELLAKQFSELDRYMNQMTSLSDYLGTTFDSLANVWGGGSK